jgi:hypothetical protein
LMFQRTPRLMLLFRGARIRRVLYLSVRLIR